MYFIFSDNVHILCLSCNVRQLKTTVKLSKQSRNKCCFNHFLFVSSVTSAFLLFPILTVAQHGSGTRKTTSWSMTVHNKHLYSEYNFTAQIEPVQDK